MVVVPVLEERLVLVRRLMVTEEVRFRLRMEEEPVTLSAAVRRQDVSVTRLPVDEDVSPEASGPHETRNPGETTSMQRTLTAMFDSRAEADRAAEALRGLGINAGNVQVHPAESSGGSASDLFVSDEDRAVYDEGFRRGHVVLSAQVDDRYLDHAMDAMEAAGAVDLDARESSWRQEGWTGHSGTASGMRALAWAARAGAAAGTAPHRHRRDGARTGTASTRPAHGEPRGGQGRHQLSGAHPSMSGAARPRDRHDGPRLAPARTAQGMTGREETIPIVEERHPHRQARDPCRPRARPLLRDRDAGRGAGAPARGACACRAPRRRPPGHRQRRRHVPRAGDRGRGELRGGRGRQGGAVTGEVVVNKEVRERTETIRDSVRRTEVEVDEDNVANTNTTRHGDKGVA
jgi:hypothetical protein